MTNILCAITALTLDLAAIKHICALRSSTQFIQWPAEASSCTGKFTAMFYVDIVDAVSGELFKREFFESATEAHLRLLQIEAMLLHSHPCAFELRVYEVQRVKDCHLELELPILEVS